MRDIKFRVWLSESKRMVLPVEGDRLIINESSELEYHFGAEKGIIQLFTGLKDKNGKEIYEGDVIRTGDWIGDVQFLAGCWYLAGVWGELSIVCCRRKM